MKYYVVFDGQMVVGKYESSKPPSVPDNLSVDEVSNLSDYEVEEWWFER